MFSNFQLADSLAGRMESISLPTLSECEINNTEPTFSLSFNISTNNKVELTIC
ncbi:MAG: hypothetical protein GQ546_13975 [Gammaproteobacteria bacterium]|nr:hypothetical protein [Gammaproteobacteria bacterium]